LIDAEQHVGEHDPPPRRCPDDEEGNGETDQPASDQHRLSSISIAERAREEVRRSLHESERDDERKRDGEATESEVFLGEERENRALLTDHAANESVDRDE
jgi:hypothetical protein